MIMLLFQFYQFFHRKYMLFSCKTSCIIFVSWLHRKLLVLNSINLFLVFGFASWTQDTIKCLASKADFTSKADWKNFSFLTSSRFHQN